MGESDPVGDSESVVVKKQIDREAANKTCCETLYSFVTPQTAVAGLVLCIMAGAFIYLVFSGYLTILQEFMLDNREGGYAIFLVLFILVGQPFGWGYSVLKIMCGFIYNWEGLIVAQVCTYIAAIICFFEVRYFARDFVDTRVDRLKPKLQLMVKKLEVIATKNMRTSYPFMIGMRLSPVTFGLANSIFAITDVTFLRYLITTMIGTLIEAPININIGILLRQLDDLAAQNDNQVSVNGTNVDDANEEVEQLEQISVIISIVITVLFLALTAAYTHWFMKQINGASEEEIWNEIERIENEDEDEINNIFTSTRSLAIYSSEKDLSQNKSTFEEPV